MAGWGLISCGLGLLLWSYRKAEEKTAMWAVTGSLNASFRFRDLAMLKKGNESDLDFPPIQMDGCPGWTKP